MRKIMLCILAILFTLTSNTAVESSPESLGTSKPIPILTYHSVTDNIFSDIENMFIRPAEFEKQIKLIINQGFTPIFASEINTAYKYKNPVVITFDDGYMDNYETVYPLIKKNKIKITIFVITNLLGRKYYLTEDAVREMHKSGLVSIQSHTSTHQRLPLLNDAQLENEFKASNDAIYKLVKRYPAVIAYPYGVIEPYQLKLVEKYYKLGFTTYAGVMSNECNKYIIKRLQVNPSVTQEKLKEYLNSFKNPDTP